MSRLTVAQIQQAYVVFFGRPADHAGLIAWQGFTGNVQALYDSFARSPEYTAQFAGLNATQQITLVYQNLLGREPEFAGLQYWLGEMTSGRVTVSNLALAIGNGALGNDIATVANRVTAATNFTAAIDTTAEAVGFDHNAFASARAWLAGINHATPATALTAAAANTALGDAVAARAGVVATGQTFMLTTGVDTIPGLLGSAGTSSNAGNDTINGLQDMFLNGGTYSAADVINGGDGTGDTLNVTVVGAAVATQVSNVEIINVRDTVDASTFDASAITNATQFWSNNSTATAEILGIQNAATVGVRGGNGTNSVQFTFRDTLIPNAATTGTQNIALDNADITTLSIGTATAAGANELTTLAFDAVGVSRIRGVAGADGLVDSTAGLGGDLDATTTINVGGTGSLRADEFLVAATVRTVDASNNGGGVRLDLSGVTAGAAQSVTGGSGNDRFNFGNELDVGDTVNGNGGTADTFGITDADDLTAAAGARVTNFEILEIGAGDGTAYTVSRIAGLTEVRIGNHIATNIAVAVTTTNQTLAQTTRITADIAAASNVTLGFSDAGVGGADAHTVILDATSEVAVAEVNGVDFGAASALVATNVDNLTINSIGAPGVATNENSIATLAGNTDLNTLTITGNTQLEITATGAIAVDTVTAARFDATLQYFGQANTAAAAITGGLRADIIYGGAAVGDNISGGAGGDILIGGTGADVINGGAGNDYLIGRALSTDTAAGAFALTYAAAAAGDVAAADDANIDRFVFDSALSATNNVDRIGGFTTASDVIVLDDAIFTGVGVGTGTASAGGTDLVRYGEGATIAAAVAASGLANGSAILAVTNGGNTDLFHVADVTAGAATAVQFATLIGVTIGAVANTDFVVI